MRHRPLTRPALVAALAIALSGALGTAAPAAEPELERIDASTTSGAGATAPGPSARSGAGADTMRATVDLTIPDAAWTTFRDLNLARLAVGSDPVIRHGSLDAVAAQWASTQAANGTSELDDDVMMKLPAGVGGVYQLLLWWPGSDVDEFLELVRYEFGLDSEVDPGFTDSGIAVARSNDMLYAYLILAEYAHSTPAADEQPLYRFYQPAAGTHFYSTSPAERNSVIGIAEYRYEGLVAYIKAPSSAPSATLNDLNRFHLRSAGTHFYTASPSEYAAVLTYPQYSLDGVAGRVSSQPGPDLSAMHRFFRPASGTHFYSANAAEVETVKAIPGFTYEGVAFYLRVAS